MEIKIYESSGKVLIRLRGRIVLDECDRLKSTIIPLVTPSITAINLDLSEVDFVDSAGLGALVGIKVSSNKHRARLALINPSRNVSDILMVSKLDSIFDIVTGADAEELIRSLAQPQYERSAGDGPPGPQLSRGPVMPSMPGMSVPRGGPSLSASTPASPKEQIDRLCRDAVDAMKKGDYEAAANCYVEAIRINPDYLPAHNNLAIVYEKVPQWQDKAIEQWEKVLELSQRRGDGKHVERAQKHLSHLRQMSR
jgi:anti-sigma B factor antagonist